MANIGIWQLLIVAVIILLLFGTKKLRTLGSDLGSSVKGFKQAMASEQQTDLIASSKQNDASQDKQV